MIDLGHPIVDILTQKNINVLLQFTGTKESYSGPLHLVESIRIALGNMPNHKKQFLSSEPEHPGDKHYNKPVHTKDTSDAGSKNDTNAAEMQRQKMP